MWMLTVPDFSCSAQRLTPRTMLPPVLKVRTCPGLSEVTCPMVFPPKAVSESQYGRGERLSPEFVCAHFAIQVQAVTLFIGDLLPSRSETMRVRKLPGLTDPDFLTARSHDFPMHRAPSPTMPPEWSAPEAPRPPEPAKEPPRDWR